MRRLLVSDIHLNDYSRFNKEPYYRLRLVRVLADRLVELGKEYDCDELDIAGDLLEKPTNRPYVVYELYTFLETLSKGFNRVNYILGQHDLDLKLGTHSVSDSIVNSIDFHNVHYMNKKMYEYGGRTIAYMDWYPEQDLTWIDRDKVDLLVGHVTIDERFGQEIDTSRFDLGIFGDIHQHKVVGKVMCIGTPMQNKLGDQAAGTVVIWDSTNNTAKHVEVDPDHKLFPRYVYTELPDEEGWSPTNPLLYRVYRRLTVNSQGQSESIKDISMENLHNTINKFIDSEGLSDIHSEVLATVDPRDSEPIDFNFTLKKLYIKNYRSISELTYEFGDRNTMVLGSNGSGKSSFILAIYKALIGDRSIMHSIRRGETEMIIQLTLVYQDQEYEITRGSRNSLKINGEQLKFNNKSELDKEIPNRLPFVKYLDSYFLNYWNTELLGSINNNRRVELINKYNRLDILESYFNRVQSIIQDNNDKISETKINIETSKGIIKNSEERLESDTKSLGGALEEIGKLDGGKSRSEIEKISLDYNVCKSNSEIRKSLEKSISDNRSIYNSREHVSEDDVKSVSDSIDSVNDKISNSKRDHDLLDEIIKFVTSSQDELSNIDKSLKKLDEEVSSLENDICPYCLSKLNGSSNANLIVKANNSINDLLDRKKNLESGIRIKLGNHTLEDIRERLDSSTKSLDDLSSQIDSLNNKRVAFSESINNDRRILESIEKDKYLITKLSTTKAHEDAILSYDIEGINSVMKWYREVDVLEKNIKDHKGTIEEHTDYINNRFSRELEDLTNYSSRLVTYRDLMSLKGPIYREILSTVTSNLTNELFKFNIVSERVSGAEYLDINVRYKVGDSYIPYKDLSSGQKTLCDLYFISKVIVNGGILVMDEFLRFLDEENLPVASDIMESTDVNQIIISTHNSNFMINNVDVIRFMIRDGITMTI